MRGFVALLGWEWRSHRVIAYAMAALMLVLSLAFRGLSTNAHYWDDVATLAVPLMWLLFAGGLAADVMSGELAARRMETLALVPASLLEVWTSKTTFVVLVLTVSLAWTIACQSATAAVFDADRLGDRIAQSLRLAEALPVALPPILLTMLVATLTERTLVAVFVGLAVAAGAAAGLQPLLRLFEPAFAKSPWGVTIAWQALGAAFATASATVFVRGGVHTGDRLQRWIVAAALAGIGLLGGGGFAAWEFCSWKQLSPGDADAVVTVLSVSPDGKWLAIGAAKHGNGEMGVTTTRVWTMPVDGGAIVASGRDRSLDANSPWDDDGSLRLLALAGRAYAREFADPATGSVRRTETAHLGASAPVRRSAVWNLATPRRLVRIDAATGDDTTLLDSTHVVRSFTPSRDDSRLLVTVDQEGTLVLDARTGAVVTGPWPTGVASWPTGAASGRFVVRDEPPQRSLVDLSTGRTIACGEFRHRNLPDLVELADGRTVTLTADARIDLRAANGDVVRRLYPPEGDAR